MTALGHFETKSDTCHCASIGLILLQERRSGARRSNLRVRLVHLFTPPPSSFSSGHHLEQRRRSPSSARRTTNDGRPAKRHSLADKLTVEAKVFAGLKIEML